MALPRHVGVKFLPGSFFSPLCMLFYWKNNPPSVIYTIIRKSKYQIHKLSCKITFFFCFLLYIIPENFPEKNLFFMKNQKSSATAGIFQKRKCRIVFKLCSFIFICRYHIINRQIPEIVTFCIYPHHDHPLVVRNPGGNFQGGILIQKGKNQMMLPKVSKHIGRAGKPNHHRKPHADKSQHDRQKTVYTVDFL